MATRLGSSADRVSAIFTARSQLTRAAAMSRLVAHVAAKGFEHVDITFDESTPPEDPDSGSRYELS
jgi:hypothetical protein